MYIPEIYKEKDVAEIKSFIRANNFGIIINTVEGRPWGTHIPFVLSEREDQLVLTAHLSKANQQSLHFTEEEALIIFNGPHAYISSSWYDHENVPTWNYTAVHLYGKVRKLTSEELFTAMDELVNQHEKEQQKPISLHELSEETMEQMNGIVGIEIIVSEIQAQRKMSQNRNQHNYKRVIDALEETDSPMDQLVAEEMKKRKS